VGFLEKAKEKAGQLVEPIKEKVDDRKDRRKADDLLDDLGRIAYRQRTGRGRADDEAEISRLVVELQALEAEGTDVLATKHDDGTGGGD
jgi:hypothetical protein